MSNVKASRNGVKREFPIEVWDKMPADKYGWTKQAELPEEVKALRTENSIKEEELFNARFTRMNEIGMVLMPTGDFFAPKLATGAVTNKVEVIAMSDEEFEFLLTTTAKGFQELADKKVEAGDKKTTPVAVEKANAPKKEKTPAKEKPVKTTKEKANAPSEK